MKKAWHFVITFALIIFVGITIGARVYYIYELDDTQTAMIFDILGLIGLVPLYCSFCKYFAEHF